MIFLDIHNDRFEAVEVFGVPALFTTLRITRSTVPKGLYAYDMQMSEDDFNFPSLLAKWITVEHFGTILAARPIELPENGYRDMEPSDFRWPNNTDRPTVTEFAKKHNITLSPPTQAKVEKSEKRPAR